MRGDVIEGENLYKITSAEPIPDSVIAEMFGKFPDTPLDSLDIRWIHRQVWPLPSPKRTRGPQLDNIELADGLFYTGIGEELVSSMEMSCRMGRQVADIIYRNLRYPEWSMPKQRIPTQMIFQFGNELHDGTSGGRYDLSEVSPSIRSRRPRNSVSDSFPIS
jgi:Prenylcysteine lyase